MYIVKKDDTLKTLPITKGVKSTINITANQDCSTIISKGNDVNIEQNISINENISAPISKGDVVGKLEFSLNGNIISECDLIACDSVDKIDLISMEKLIVGDWLELLR